MGLIPTPALFSLGKTNHGTRYTLIIFKSGILCLHQNWLKPKLPNLGDGAECGYGHLQGSQMIRSFKKRTAGPEPGQRESENNRNLEAMRRQRDPHQSTLSGDISKYQGPWSNPKEFQKTGSQNYISLLNSNIRN